MPVLPGNVAGAEVSEMSQFGQLTNSIFGALIDALIFEIKSERNRKRERRNRGADCLGDNDEKSLLFYKQVSFLTPKIRPKLYFFQNAHVDTKRFRCCLNDRKILNKNFLNLTFRTELEAV